MIYLFVYLGEKGGHQTSWPETVKKYANETVDIILKSIKPNGRCDYPSKRVSQATRLLLQPCHRHRWYNWHCFLLLVTPQVGWVHSNQSTKSVMFPPNVCINVSTKWVYWWSSLCKLLISTLIIREYYCWLAISLLICLNERKCTIRSHFKF